MLRPTAAGFQWNIVYDDLVSDTKKQFPDPLVRQKLFPEPAQIFDFAPKNLQEALTNGIVAVDTNVLLVPYTTGRASLEQIRRTYERLTSESRLRIPGQVAREFADNRAEKLKTLFQQLSRKRAVNIVQSQYPLLEGIPEYSDLVKRETDISAALSEYRHAVSGLLDVVAGWQWNDPVSEIYRDLFKPTVIVDSQITREDLLNDLKYRQEHRIPPGFKDAGNEYSGVGDLLIWRALLHIGEQNRVTWYLSLAMKRQIGGINQKVGRCTRVSNCSMNIEERQRENHC